MNYGEKNILPGDELPADGIGIVDVVREHAQRSTALIGYQHSIDVAGTDMDLVKLDRQGDAPAWTPETGFGHIVPLLSRNGPEIVEAVKQQGFRSDVYGGLVQQDLIAHADPLILMRANTHAGNYAATIQAIRDPEIRQETFQQYFDHTWSRTVIASDAGILNGGRPGYSYAIPMDDMPTHANIVVGLSDHKTTLRDPEEEIDPTVERIAGRLIVGPLVEAPYAGPKYSAIHWKVEGPSERGDGRNMQSESIIGLLVIASGRNDATSSRTSASFIEGMSMDPTPASTSPVVKNAMRIVQNNQGERADRNVG